MRSAEPPDSWPSAPEDGFTEPDPDDADTGPLHISTPPRSLPEGGLPGDARLYTPTDSDWPRRFEPLLVNPQPVRRARKPMLLLALAALAVVVVVGGLAVWLLRPSSSAPSSAANDLATSNTAPSDSPEAAAHARLLRLLPAGYPSDSCKPVSPNGAPAEVDCERNIDPGGPQSATYTLASDKAALDAAFNDIVHTATRVNCPGNIQSPGPWRRNATPHKTSGVLFCGLQDGRPTVAWTDEDDLLVSTVQSGPQGLTFDQLYAWWSSHS